MKKPLYVSRKVINGDALIKWANEQGIHETLDVDDLHTTVVYSKEPMDWDAVEEDAEGHEIDEVDFEEGDEPLRRMSLFGPDKDVLVLEILDDEYLQERFDLYREAGASFDYDKYCPHITISKTLPEGMKLEDIEPYNGPIVYGPEAKEEIKENPYEKEEVTESFGAKLSPTPDNIQKARDFVFRKWKERAAERGMPEPKDLSYSCKFSSLFVKEIFGGKLEGNYDHQYVRLDNGKILDLNIDAEDVQELGDDAHEHDEDFFGNPDHRESVQSCLPRVRQWVKEFQSEVYETVSLFDALTRL